MIRGATIVGVVAGLLAAGTASAQTVRADRPFDIPPAPEVVTSFAPAVKAQPWDGGEDWPGMGAFGEDWAEPLIIELKPIAPPDMQTFSREPQR